MIPYRPPLDDILFTLRHAALAEQIEDFDAEFAGEVASHFVAFAEGELAPLNASGDFEGCRLENGRVRMPEGFPEAYRRYCEQGWPGLSVPEAFGGQGQGAVAQALVSEVFSGANHSLQMITGLVPGAVRVLLDFGTEEQRARHVPGLASGDLLATMCLTEPGAGSDLSRIRCRAARDGDGWRLDGEKIFISGGDQDLSEGTLHLVLARTSDDGIKGLSLFLARDVRGDGARNGISVPRIEEKMGLHASPTCTLVFDRAEAELVGTEGQGLRAMFTMMNHARIDVALQGVAHAARTYQIAASYAAGRKQGRKADGSDAVLSDHADVRRMLDEIDAAALGGRAIAHLALVTLECGEDPALVEFLTPVAKFHCTEAGIRAAEQGIQVLGGYGYLTEYGLDQTYRDARITSIYEGANGSHARMLATRLAKGAEGDAFHAFLGEEAQRSGEVVATGLESWREALRLLAQSPDPGELAHDFMQLTASVLLQALWARMEAAAAEHPDPDRIRRLSARVARSIDAFAPGYLHRIRGDAA